MKKLNFVAFKKLILLGALMVAIAFGTTACTTMSYIGDDYNVANSTIVKTNENFLFSTYKKTSEQEAIDLRLGVSKSAVDDTLVTYIEIRNNSKTNDYIFYTKDFAMKSGDTALAQVTTSNYLGSYQSLEAGIISSLSQASPTLGNIATIANTYHQLNTQSTENSSSTSNNSALKQINQITNGISSHSINSAGVIKPQETKYFYYFVKDPTTYPIDIVYKDLKYSFLIK